MSTTIEARFDGQVFHPLDPISLPPDTTVRLTIETMAGEPYSFLRLARELNIEGPPDWATNIESFPHGKDADDADDAG
jgi:predicted DNA-binding antitoxin AbrB/MazE fold protein